MSEPGEVVEAPLDQARFRQVLGRFCTGVAVVAGVDGGRPVGFACQSFAALSLEPPLVLFCPSRGSRTWAILARSGRFCVNVLAEDQRPMSSMFGRAGTDKFAGVRWRPSESGSPMLEGALAWIDCTVETVYEAGDHYVVIGRVRALEDHGDQQPLLFYRGSYARVEPVRQACPEELEGFLTWPCRDDWV